MREGSNGAVSLAATCCPIYMYTIESGKKALVTGVRPVMLILLLMHKGLLACDSLVEVCSECC
jgi:hypothetical protein